MDGVVNIYIDGKEVDGVGCDVKDGAGWYVWERVFRVGEKGRGMKGVVAYWEKERYEIGGLLYGYVVMQFNETHKWKVEWRYKINSSYDSVKVGEVSGVLRDIDLDDNCRVEGTELWIYRGSDRVLGLVWKDGYSIYIHSHVIEITKEGYGDVTELIGPAIGNSERYYDDRDRDGVPDEVERGGWSVLWEDARQELEETSVSSDCDKRDTDGDGLSDLEEWLLSGTSPMDIDTDGDGVDDYSEYVKEGTSPLNQDTDRDGLEDGKEYYTKVYEYDMRVMVNGDASRAVSVEEDRYSKGLKDAYAVIGVRGNLSVWVYVDGTLVSYHSVRGTEFWKAGVAQCMADKKATVSVNMRGHGWLESLKVVLVEKSDPLNEDTDGDGLKDGYEALGISGYITSPLNIDTDGDGISDGWEIKGWSWDYATKSRYRDRDGYHTNPLSNDTDGDGCPDSEDADPVGNLMLKMTLEKYRYYEHPSYTKFAGFYMRWSLGKKSKSYEYFTKHKGGSLSGYTYWVDVPDSVHTNVSILSAAFYNDLGDKNITSASRNVSFNVRPGYSVYENVSDASIMFYVSYEIVSLKRVNVVGVYNSSMFRWGQYQYRGKYYVVYVDNTGDAWFVKDVWNRTHLLIAKGLNTIVVPESLFVNSELYRAIKHNDTNKINALVGTDAKVAKMGAIGAKSNGVHIVGMFFLKVNSGDGLRNLLYLITHNESGVKFGDYETIEPCTANLPVDVLALIPYVGIENSATGDEPKDLLGQIVKWVDDNIVEPVVNAAVTAAKFIYNGLVAVGNFIVQAAEVVAKAALVLIDYIQHPEKLRAALEQAASVFNAVVEWVKRVMISAYKEVVNRIKNEIEGLEHSFKELVIDVASWIEQGGPEKLLSTVVKAIADFMSEVLKVALVMMGIFLAATAVMIAVKVATAGVGAFISQLLYQTVLKELLFKMVLAGALIGTFKEVRDLFEEGEEPDEGLSKIIEFVGISGVAVEKMYAIGDAIIERAKGKIGIFGYYLGIVLAFSGVLAEAATATLSGDLLKDATLAAVAISVLGLVRSLWLLKRDPELEAKEQAVPLITMIELAIGICGVVSATAKAIDVWSGD